jgi:hypothetical protein
MECEDIKKNFQEKGRKTLSYTYPLILTSMSQNNLALNDMKLIESKFAHHLATRKVMEQ